MTNFNQYLKRIMIFAIILPLNVFAQFDDDVMKFLQNKFCPVYVQYYKKIKNQCATAGDFKTCMQIKVPSFNETFAEVMTNELGGNKKKAITVDEVNGLKFVCVFKLNFPGEILDF